MGASFSWTYACFLWRQQTRYFSSIHVNVIKNIIAFIIFLPIIFTFDFISNFKYVCILLLSGIIGIAIGDSLYITALKKIGTRKTLTVEATSPIIASLLGSFMLNEVLQLKVWIGVLIVTISLIGIASQNVDENNNFKFNSINQKGFFFAFLSVFCAVVAAALSRIVLLNSSLNPFQTTEIRLLGSVLALLLSVNLNLIRSIKELPPANKIRLFYATFLGTNLGILLQQNVFQSLPIGLGWTLLSTSPAISLLFARAEGEKVNWKSIVLTGTTILGVSIVFI
ncbi:Permease of the drug/metabolite transporter [Prochlorococcus sp. SS52]|nr:Permease of the drug/metabolite transporter [Prochlorococcus marinus str. LG]KGG22604.1 Permease of the drug/metabolite transporter [Prochlorococcus marinus str. SS2]KGG33144.1 Permease of the drug/metabolite transporter [Prochlorococcus marinus str. SS51]KGG37434.1 Permease of the drug/metabolite transporter [Prochlorococcus sp. SS52]